MRRNAILVVDDMEIDREILEMTFSDSYKVIQAANGNEALSKITEHKDELVAIILDVMMPDMSGFDVVDKMEDGDYRHIVPVIFVTAERSFETEIKAFDIGAADVIIKPHDPKLVRRRVENNIELCRHRNQLEQLVQEKTAKLVEANLVIMDALITIIEYRSMESGQHIKRIRGFTELLLLAFVADKEARELYQLTPERVKLITRASALHDIGKIAIPDAILNKPGRLTEEEFEIMKGHTVKGCEILELFGALDDKDYLEYAYNICRYHHERWDGRGYPDGLHGDYIPICGQIVAVADVYDALTTKRVYKPAFAHEKAVSMIVNGECGVFSPKILDIFIKLSDEFRKLAEQFADTIIT